MFELEETCLQKLAAGESKQGDMLPSLAWEFSKGTRLTMVRNKMCFGLIY